MKKNTKPSDKNINLSNGDITKGKTQKRGGKKKQKIINPFHISFPNFARTEKEFIKWLFNYGFPSDSKPILEIFNKFNQKVLYYSKKNPGEGQIADNVTLCHLVGVSFDDKRIPGLDFHQLLINNDHSGRLILKHRPYIDEMAKPEENDPYAIEVIPDSWNKMIGYIPRQINRSFWASLRAKKLCGCFVAESNSSKFLGKDTPLFRIICGWKTKET